MCRCAVLRVKPVVLAGKPDKVDAMKQILHKAALLMLIPALLALGGCGGYARTPNSSSGIDAYGVIDVGVQHTSP